MAIAAKPTFFPRFAINNVTDGGGRVNVTEPPTDKKNSGWEYLEKPARDYMNWIHRGNYLWIDYFNQFWNSSHQFVINEIESEGGAGISILDTLKVDAITELTGSAGVTIEGITLIDGYINEPVGIKVAPVSGTNLHVHQADSAASLQRFTNSTTGATATDGFEIGLGASEQGRLWNYENTDIVIGTNNTERLILSSLAVGTGLKIKGDLNSERFTTESGVAAVFQNARYKGTYTSKTAVLVDEALGFFQSGGYDGTTMDYNNCAIAMWAAENFDPTHNGTYMSFYNTNIGAVARTEKMRLTDAGYLGIGVTPSNPLHVQSTTTPQVRIGYDAGSYATIGVADGGALSILAGEASGSITVQAGASAPYFQLTAGTNFLMYSLDNGERMQMGHDGTNGFIYTVGTNAGNIVITNTTECTGADTGALQVDGGADFAKHVRAGLGIIPAGKIHGNNVTYNTIFDTLSPYIPNTNDEIKLTGGWADTGETVLVTVSYAKRKDASTITIYGTHILNVTETDVADGSATAINISISW